VSGSYRSRFLVGSKVILVLGHASGGKLSYIFGWVGTLLSCSNYVAMARVLLVSVVLVGPHGDSVTRRLRRDSPFREIFVAYVYQAGIDPEVTRFFYLDGVIGWGSTPGDHMFPDGGRIHVLTFGWLFSGVDLEYIDQWVGPSPLRGGFCCLDPCVRRG